MRISFFLIFFIIVSCQPYFKKKILPQEFFKKTNNSFFIEGKFKIKRSNYGFFGNFQVIKLKDSIRLDIFTPFYSPLLSFVKKDNSNLILYQNGSIYTEEESIKIIKKLLPAGLNLEAFVAILGNQFWFIPFNRYCIKENKNEYHIWLMDKKGRQQEIWINKINLKTKKFVLKNSMEEILCKVFFHYEKNKIKSINIIDMFGTKFKITYESFKKMP